MPERGSFVETLVGSLREPRFSMASQRRRHYGAFTKQSGKWMKVKNSEMLRAGIRRQLTDNAQSRSDSSSRLWCWLTLDQHHNPRSTLTDIRTLKERAGFRQLNVDRGATLVVPRAYV